MDSRVETLLAEAFGDVGFSTRPLTTGFGLGVTLDRRMTLDRLFAPAERDGTLAAPVLFELAKKVGVLSISNCDLRVPGTFLPSAQLDPDTTHLGQDLPHWDSAAMAQVSCLFDPKRLGRMAPTVYFTESALEQALGQLNTGPCRASQISGLYDRNIGYSLHPCSRRSRRALNCVWPRLTNEIVALIPEDRKYVQSWPVGGGGIVMAANRRDLLHCRPYAGDSGNSLQGIDIAMR